jgi:hypothetical protein
MDQKTITNKKIAVLLFGLYYCKNYKDIRGNNTTINIIETNNIRDFLYNLVEHNNTLDYYVHTTSSPYDDLLKIFFDTENIIFDNDPPIRPGRLIYKKRNERIVNLFDIIDTYEYDYFIISRIDCTFIMPFSLLDINWDKLNISMRCERPSLYDDNFFIIPSKFIRGFIKLVEVCRKFYLNTHNVSVLYDKYIGKKNIHFIIKGLYWIGSYSPLYILPRQITREQKGFVLNRLILEPRYVYRSNGSELQVSSKNEYVFSAKNKGWYHWIGYSLYKPNKNIQLNFDILLINELIYSPQIGIKADYFPKIYNDWVPKLKVNEWVNIEYNITLNSNSLNQLVLLIFDDAENVNLEIRNFKCGNIVPNIIPFS